MKIKFIKMEGIGNDYIYIDCIKDSLKIDSINKLAVKLSDRHFGIGSDGLVLILSSKIADFKMRMFNNDGSEGKMCGNAVRCIGKYVYEKKYIHKNIITLETLSGIKHLKLKISNDKVKEVEVDMGKVILDSNLIPVLTDKKQFINELIYVDNKWYNVSCLSVGNPHCVIFIDNIDKIDISKTGKKIETHKLFPDKINTEFVQINDKNNISMRVWERGSGETLACGTGACASVVASVINGLVEYDNEIIVNLKGGILKVIYTKDKKIIMKGIAKIVFYGEIEI